MAKFSELGITTDSIIGKAIGIDELFDRRILIEKTITLPTKFPGKNASGMRMQMQVVLATFDEDGKYEIDENGKPKGERRSCFTASDNLIKAIKDAQDAMPSINAARRSQGLEPKVLYPLDTTIVKIGKCFQFT